MATKIEAMQGSLNVKKNNLNNKRLSRLQGVILKILSAAYPTGYDKRMLSRLTAEGYGKGSIITRTQKEARMVEAMPEMREMLQEMRSLTPRGARRELTWLNPKFSVSYSRSIRNLLGQRLVAYLPATRTDGKEGWAVFITEKGLAITTKKKVKINAKFWDAFQASLKKEEIK